jgi:hypothetical protein
VYNCILRFLWQPREFQQIVDELLHSVIPVLFITFWIIFIPKARLKLKIVLSWLLYPLVYLIFILTRGSFASFYPYPFIDADKIGYSKVFINATGMLAAFLLVSILFVIINYLKKYRFNNL